MKNKNKNAKQSKYNHPGRPRHNMKWPKSKQFTFADIMDANGCDTKHGKHYGKKVDEDGCTMLTCRKNLKNDMYILNPKTNAIVRVNPRSEVVVIRGVTAEPNSERGLGRRADLFCLRVNKDSIKVPNISAKPATVKAGTKSQTPTSDALDKIHAALAAPEPIPAAVTVPAVTIAPTVVETAPEAPPVVNVPALVTEAVVETPAPAAPVAETPAPAEIVPASTLANS